MYYLIIVCSYLIIWLFLITQLINIPILCLQIVNVLIKINYKLNLTNIWWFYILKKLPSASTCYSSMITAHYFLKYLFACWENSAKIFSDKILYYYEIWICCATLYKDKILMDIPDEKLAASLSRYFENKSRILLLLHSRKAFYFE